MSKSPKKSSAQLQREYEAIIRRQQEEQQEQARLRRVQQQAAEQRLRLATARREGEGVADRIVRQTGSLTAGNLSRWLDHGAVNSVRREADTLRVTLTGGDESHVRKQTSALERVESQLKTLEKAAQKVEDRAVATQRQLASLRSRLETSTASRVDRFLSASLVSRVQQALNETARRLEVARSLADLQEAERELARTENEFGPELLRASRLADQWVARRTQLAAARQSWDALLQGNLARFVGESERGVLSASLEAAATQLELASDEAALIGVETSLKRLTKAIADASTTARASLRAEHLAAEEAALAELSEAIEAADQKHAMKFDRSGFEASQRNAAAAERAQQAGDLEGLRRELQTTRQTWQQHQQTLARNVERWEESRRAAEVALTPLLDRLTRAGENPRLQRWLGSELEPLQTRGAELRSLFDAEDFAKVAADAPQVIGAVDRLLESVRLLEQGASELERLQEQFTELEDATGGRFNETGRQNIATYLDAARAALRQGDATKLNEYCVQANGQWEKHRPAVLREFEAWQQDRDSALTVVGAAKDQLAALESDEVVVRWMGTRLGELRASIQKAEGSIEAGRFAEATRAVSGLEEQAKKIVADVAPLELQAARQRKISEGMQEAMRRMGFVVNAAGPEVPGNPESALILQAAKPGSGPIPGEISIAIEQNGAVEYDVGGAFKKEATWTEKLKRVVRSCDEAESRILEMHALLKSLGIEMDGLWWDDQPPERPTTVKTDVPVRHGALGERTQTRR